MTILIRLLVLCSGLFQRTSAENRLRFFWIGKNKKLFSDTLRECTTSGGSMATLYDEDDANFVYNLTKSRTTSGSSYWLGLHKQSNVTTRSNGDPVLFNASTAHIKQGEQTCEAFENGTWRNFSCSDRKPFMCQKGNNYTLIKEEKNWCQALQLCRTRYTDLAKIDDTQQNEELKNSSWNQTFWIGLLHDEWRWADKSCSTYRNWDFTSELDSSKDVSMFSNYNKFSWKMENDLNDAVPLCTKGFVRIKAIKEPKSWEEAINYCKSHHTQLLWIEDQEDQMAVQQWLNHNSNVKQSYWISLKQSSVFGFWIWSDRIVNWSNWKNGRAPEMPLSKPCGVINASSYEWSDEYCWQKLPFLCEEDIFYMYK